MTFQSNKGSCEEVNYFCVDASTLDFSDTLLIINYNHPYYGTIPFLREIYSHIFPNIVFYGEETHPEVIALKHHKGWYGQRVISDAMERWPDYKGYICVQDDCFMNFWNFARLDKNKIWTSYPEGIISLSTLHHPWCWWQNTCGHFATKKAIGKLQKKYVSMLASNIGPKKVAFTYHDFVYIPGHMRTAFIELCSCFNDPPVFVELALINILLCMEKIDNIEFLKQKWDFWNVTEEYNTFYDWVHPIKFSRFDNQEIMRSVVNIWKIHQEELRRNSEIY